MEECSGFLILSDASERHPILVVGLLDIMVSRGIQKDLHLIKVPEERFRFRGKWIRCSL